MRRRRRRAVSTRQLPRIKRPSPSRAPRSSRSASPLGRESTPPVLRDFLLHLASERGLADNTLHAYRRDLTDISKYLSQRGKTLMTGRADDFRAYLQNQRRGGQSTKTIARRVAAIRVYFRYRAGLGEDVSSILAQIERPK